MQACPRGSATIERDRESLRIVGDGGCRIAGMGDPHSAGRLASVPSRSVTTDVRVGLGSPRTDRSFEVIGPIGRAGQGRSVRLTLSVQRNTESAGGSPGKSPFHSTNRARPKPLGRALSSPRQRENADAGDRHGLCEEIGRRVRANGLNTACRQHVQSRNPGDSQGSTSFPPPGGGVSPPPPLTPSPHTARQQCRAVCFSGMSECGRLPG